MRVWRALLSFFGAALVLAPRSAGAAAPPVHLEVEGCPSLDAKAVQRIFSADLGTTAMSETGPDVTEVTITCEGNRVTVRVRDPISRKTVKRSFDPKSFGTQAEFATALFHTERRDAIDPHRAKQQTCGGEEAEEFEDQAWTLERA